MARVTKNGTLDKIFLFVLFKSLIFKKLTLLKDQ
jgi:hypothetical protein